MASEETENGSENNFTITFPSHTSHKSLSTELYISTMNLFKQLKGVVCRYCFDVSHPISQPVLL